MTAKSDKAATPKGCLVFMWISGVVAILLFLAPTAYVIKYFAFDSPAESAAVPKLNLTLPSTASGPAADLKTKQISTISLANSAVLVQDLQKDPDPVWRARAARSLGQMLAIPYSSVTHPMEGLIAKSALSTAAVSDKDDTVRAAASDALHGVARNGAVIER
jgi:hypothetical protein